MVPSRSPLVSTFPGRVPTSSPAVVSSESEGQSRRPVPPPEPLLTSWVGPLGRTSVGGLVYCSHGRGDVLCRAKGGLPVWGVPTPT